MRIPRKAGNVGAIIGAAISWLGGILGTLFVGWKGFFVLTFLSFLGINLYNLFVEIAEEITSFIVASTSAIQSPTGSSLVAEFAGVAGYLATHLRLVECISFILNIVILKWLVVKIPLLKW